MTNAADGDFYALESLLEPGGFVGRAITGTRAFV
jgi:hypothetical protein